VQAVPLRLDVGQIVINLLDLLPDQLATERSIALSSCSVLFYFALRRVSSRSWLSCRRVFVDSLRCRSGRRNLASYSLSPNTTRAIGATLVVDSPAGQDAPRALPPEDGRFRSPAVS
jgi:hypothetical protein